MTLLIVPLPKTDTWIEFFEHWGHHIKDDWGWLGLLVVVVFVAWYALKFVRAWKGK